MPTGICLPPQIPPPERDGYDDTYEETRSSVDMQTGPPRMRNKFRVAPRLINVRWTLSNAAYRIFDIWFSETLKGGEVPFDIQLLDDTEELVWYTARWSKGEFRAEIQEDGKWVVTGTIRSTEDPFADRPSGTDELGGRGSFNFTGKGNMLIAKVLFGAGSLGLSFARGALRATPFFGQTFFEMFTRGQLTPRPFYGRGTFDLTGIAALAVFGADELILQFDAITYSAPAGGAVELQFDATVYYPPHIL